MRSYLCFASALVSCALSAQMTWDESCETPFWNSQCGTDPLITNWQPERIPGAADAVVIGVDAVVDLSGTEGAASSLNVLGELTIRTNLTVAQEARLKNSAIRLGAPEQGLIVGNTLTLSEEMTWDGGIIKADAGVSQTGTLFIGNGFDRILQATTFSNSGEVYQGTSLRLIEGSEIINGGIWELQQTNSDIEGDDSLVRFTQSSEGTLIRDPGDAGSTATFFAPVDLNGKIEIRSGDLQFFDGGALAADTTLAANTELILSNGNFDLSGEFRGSGQEAGFRRLRIEGPQTVATANDMTLALGVQNPNDNSGLLVSDQATFIVDRLEGLGRLVVDGAKLSTPADELANFRSIDYLELRGNASIHTSFNINKLYSDGAFSLFGTDWVFADELELHDATISPDDDPDPRVLARSVKVNTGEDSEDAVTTIEVMLVTERLELMGGHTFLRGGGSFENIIYSGAASCVLSTGSFSTLDYWRGLASGAIDDSQLSIGEAATLKLAGEVYAENMHIVQRGTLELGKHTFTNLSTYVLETNGSIQTYDADSEHGEFLNIGEVELSSGFLSTRLLNSVLLRITGNTTFQEHPEYPEYAYVPEIVNSGTVLFEAGRISGTIGLLHNVEGGVIESITRGSLSTSSVNIPIRNEGSLIARSNTQFSAVGGLDASTLRLNENNRVELMTGRYVALDGAVLNLGSETIESIGSNAALYLTLAGEINNVELSNSRGFIYASNANLESRIANDFNNEGTINFSGEVTMPQLNNQGTAITRYGPRITYSFSNTEYPELDPDNSPEAEVKRFNLSSTTATRLNLTAGPLLNQGVLSPGDTGLADHFTIAGDYEQTADGELIIELGNSPETSDQLIVDGHAIFGGRLTLAVLGDFSPTTDSTFEIISATTQEGTFSNIVEGRIHFPGGSFALTETNGTFILSDYQGQPLTLSFDDCESGATPTACIVATGPAGVPASLQGSNNLSSWHDITSWEVFQGSAEYRLSDSSSYSYYYYRLIIGEEQVAASYQLR